MVASRPSLAGALPVVDEALAGGVGGRRDPDATLLGVRSERLAGSADAEAGEGFAFPRGGLASVVVELGCVEAASEASEGTAGVDGGELVVVADEDDFGAAGGGVVEESGEGAGADHRGFVDHQHVGGLQLGAAGVVELVEEAVDRLGGDPGSLFELGGGAGRERAAGHVVAGAFPGIAGGGERVGLAGSCRADDDFDACAPSG